MTCIHREVEQRVASLVEGLLVDGRDAFYSGVAAAAGLLYRDFRRG